MSKEVVRLIEWMLEKNAKMRPTIGELQEDEWIGVMRREDGREEETLSRGEMGTRGREGGLVKRSRSQESQVGMFR